jgi:hypothetical protein
MVLFIVIRSFLAPLRGGGSVTQNRGLPAAPLAAIMAPVLRNFAVRAGLGATGAIYFALGIVTARVAFLGSQRKEAGIPGALRFLLAQPYGVRILAAVVLSLAAIALVHVVEAATGKRGAWTRLGLAANGFGYGALAWSAARLLFDIRKGADATGRAGASWLLAWAWGPWVLAAAGAAVVAGGLWEGYQGVRGRLPFRRDLLPRRLVRGLSAVARFGLAARGLVLCALGGFVMRAAIEGDPGWVRTVGGTLRSLRHVTFGSVLLGIAAFGLAAYGVYLWTLMLLKRRV